MIFSHSPNIAVLVVIILIMFGLVSTPIFWVSKNIIIRVVSSIHFILALFLIISTFILDQKVVEFKLYENPAIVTFYDDSVVVTDSVTKKTKSYKTMSDAKFLKNKVKIVKYDVINETYGIRFKVANESRIEKK